MPELLCSKLVLGSLPLADGEVESKHGRLGCCSKQLLLEVVVVRSVRRWNSCMTDGPLLHLAEDRREPSAKALRLSPYFARTGLRRPCWTLQLWTSNATSTTGLRPPDHSRSNCSIRGQRLFSLWRGGVRLPQSRRAILNMILVSALRYPWENTARPETLHFKIPPNPTQALNSDSWRAESQAPMALHLRWANSCCLDTPPQVGFRSLECMSVEFIHKVSNGNVLTPYLADMFAGISAGQSSRHKRSRKPWPLPWFA